MLLETLTSTQVTTVCSTRCTQLVCTLGWPCCRSWPWVLGAVLFKMLLTKKV